ncbi:PhzF family phenazine biosynthesis protein [Pontibacter sp. 172403-2]|uniref:PhzF family phenazine biosynthesis protein n=1 Tax=Pontibacter rufus TaxID=2791028 RepID=UPI0018AFB70C|nr:PhzF family phenazine biosynthesis protein [Pontibacter sp. 172403-2]MBF9254990.1 PhzF family phenazine biosynthesis protein [Pontibacter sp. 172403-2]
MNTHKSPELYLVKAFTETKEGGNAAGVVLHADTLAQQQKQQIAAGLGFSETAFVSASEIGDVKVEFFTPNRQIPHCGHATIATFSLLLQKGLVQEPGAVKESIEGPRQIDLLHGKVYQAQLAPKYTHLSETTVTADEIARSLNLPSKYKFPAEPVVASTGLGFLLVQLQHASELQALQPDQESIARISERLNVVGYYVFTTAAQGADATTRMFAPGYGIPEESATGMAAGPLACYLHDYSGFSKTNYLIHQGYLMQPPSPSQLEVQLQTDAAGRITELKAGGKAVIVQQLPLKV